MPSSLAFVLARACGAEETSTDSEAAEIESAAAASGFGAAPAPLPEPAEGAGACWVGAALAGGAAGIDPPATKLGSEERRGGGGGTAGDGDAKAVPAAAVLRPLAVRLEVSSSFF